MRKTFLKRSVGKSVNSQVYQRTEPGCTHPNLLPCKFLGLFCWVGESYISALHSTAWDNFWSLPHEWYRFNKSINQFLFFVFFWVVFTTSEKVESQAVIVLVLFLNHEYEMFSSIEHIMAGGKMFLWTGCPFPHRPALPNNWWSSSCIPALSLFKWGNDRIPCFQFIKTCTPCQWGLLGVFGQNRVFTFSFKTQNFHF